MKLLLIFLLINIQPQSFTSDQAITNDLQEIKMLIVNGDRDSAISELETIVSHQTDNVEAIVLLSDLYHQTHQFGKLITLVESNNNKVSEIGSVQFVYAQAKYQTGFKPEAIQALERNRELDSFDIRGLILLGSIYYNDENWALAQSVYRQISVSLPGNHFFRTRLAKTYGNLMDAEYARSILASVLEEDPAYLPALIELALSHFSLREFYKTNEVTSAALVMYPNNVSLNNLRARSSYNVQQFEEAVKYWNVVAELGEADQNTFRGLGLSYYQLGNAEEALKNFERVLMLNPEDTISLLYSSMVYRQKENWEKAYEILNRMFEFHITDYFIESIMQRAVVLEELGEVESAMSDYTLAKMLFPEHRKALFYLAALHDRHTSNQEVILEHYLKYLESGYTDPSLEDYAKSRVSVLRERLHFARGRE